ncbi:MAG: GAF domain-containing sensor histidine kinase [Chitinophagaceae bacterium]|jgi:signal transduction histidine kinase
MITAPIPVDEGKRIAELYKYELLDSVYEEEFGDIVKLASGLCDVPMSLITLIDIDRQWFKAKVGIDGEQTERDVSFCSHAILNNHLFEVPDAYSDERFFDNPYVTGEPHVRYYAGMPLVTESGYKLGTLCVLDTVPRQLTEEQYLALSVLSKQVIKLFELRVKNKELDRAKEVQQKMMSIMAHDIRGPLASMEMILDQRIKTVISIDKMKEIEGMIAEQLHSTVSMLNNIVDWGKLQLSNEENNQEHFNLHKLCEDCFKTVGIAAQTKNNQLVNQVDEQIEITGNKQGLEFVLRNLIGNAVKYTDSGAIFVSADIQNSKVYIAVRDTGVGISPEEIALLKERKWTVQNTGTNDEKGTGLGLQLIQGYLANINGSIIFSSEPEKGTEVRVVIPQD